MGHNISYRSPVIDRRTFLTRLAGFAACGSTALAQAGQTTTVSLLHTTDLHGHILPTVDYKGNRGLGGLARCSTQIKAWRQDSVHCITLDLGDLYQGTEVSHATKGRVMVDCLNHLDFDAWVVGNHEFDWGMQPFLDCVERSRMPVLSANCKLGPNGKLPGTLAKAEGPLSALRPYLLKEIAGFRILIVGTTTPGIPFWIPPEQREGYEVTDPVEATKRVLDEVSAEQKTDAIIFAPHMGFRYNDDFANTIEALALKFPDTAVILAAHTHREHESNKIRGVPYTQANYYGLHVGRCDLVFDNNSRKVVEVRPGLATMDATIREDPGVLALAQTELENAEDVLKRKVGRLTESLTVERDELKPPSEIERLIASAMIVPLNERGARPDVVIHGHFLRSTDLQNEKYPAGEKTIEDLWTILPYENMIVTAELTREELYKVIRDFVTDTQRRAVMGVNFEIVNANRHPRLQDIRNIRLPDDSALPDRRIRVALNAYDAQSGARRFLVARETLNQSGTRKFWPIQTRVALIDFFNSRREVGTKDLII